MMTDPDDHLGNYNLRCRVARSRRVTSLIEAYCPTLDGKTKQSLLDRVFEWHSAGVSSVEGMYDAFRIHRELPGHAPGVDTHERCLDLYAAEVCFRLNFAQKAASGHDLGGDNYERYLDSERQLRPALTTELNEAILKLYPTMKSIAKHLKSQRIYNNNVEIDEIISEFIIKILEHKVILDVIQKPGTTKEQGDERSNMLFKKMLGVALQLRSGAGTRPVSAPRRGKSKGDQSSINDVGLSSRTSEDGLAAESYDESEPDPNASDSPGGFRATARARVDPDRDLNAAEPWQLLSSDDDEDKTRAFLRQLTCCEPKKRIAYCLNQLCLVKQEDIAPMLDTSKANVCRWIKDVEGGLERPTL